MANTWFIADTHFGHANIIEYEKRPFESVEDMDRAMIENWNSIVGKEDLLYHLGDVAFHKKDRIREILKELHGIKICIRGNHDLAPGKMMSLGFHACLESAYLRVGSHDCFISHEPLQLSAANVWQLHGHVHSMWKVRAIDRKICLSVENWHYKPVSANELASIMDRAKNPWGKEGAYGRGEKEHQRTEEGMDG